METAKMKPFGFRVLARVVGAFAKMPSDVGAPAGDIASALAADHTQFFSTGAVEAKGMHKQCIWAAWGHAAHQGWARLLPDRHRDLIDHRSQAARSAGDKNGDEVQQRHDGRHYHHPGQYNSRASDWTRP